MAPVVAITSMVDERAHRTREVRGNHREQIKETRRLWQLCVVSAVTDLPETFSRKVPWPHVVVEGLVVAANALREHVGHDLIHIDTDSLHAEFF